MSYTNEPDHAATYNVSSGSVFTLTGSTIADDAKVTGDVYAKRLNIISGATATLSDIVIGEGGIVSAYPSATSKNGNKTVLLVSAAILNVNGATIESGGYGNGGNWSNFTVESGGSFRIAGGVVSNMTVQSGGSVSGFGGGADLFGQIAATDVRKGWWLDESLESPLLDAAGYNVMKADIQENGVPFQNVKFGTGDGTTSGLGAAAADRILMRAEELILIKAEGLAKSGGDGAGTLSAFVQSFRDPSYSVGSHGLSLEDEIWWQRRVELWGEGFAWGDIMRLNKDIIRSNSTNWPAEWATQDVIAGNGVLIWLIPQAEIEANQGISDADNNPAVSL